MTKREMMDFLSHYDEEDQIDEYEMAEYIRDIEEARERMIEEIEERQHASGFYAFQDTMDMYRREY